MKQPAQWIDILDFDRDALCADMDRGHREFEHEYSPNTISLYKPPVGEDLLNRMLPRVSEMAGVPLFPCHSFARVGLEGARLAPHCDRPGLDWTVSINVRRSPDTTWSIDFYHPQEGKWYEFCDDNLERGVLAHGRKVPHKRELYKGEGKGKGKRAYQLFLHYTEEADRSGDRQVDRSAGYTGPLYMKVPRLLTRYFLSKLYTQLDAQLDRGEIQLQTASVGNEARLEDTRVSEIAWLYKPGWQWLYDRVKEKARWCNRMSWEFDIEGGSCDQPQFTRYYKGGHYNWHEDWDAGGGGQIQHRTLSCTVLLRNARKGGGIELKDLQGNNTGVIPMNRGDAIFFPSSTTHRAVEVEEGVRDSLVLWLSKSL